MVRYLVDRASREKLDNVRAVLATGDDPHLEPNSVDRILVVDVWHHVADRGAYAKQLANALRPGGSIAIVDFTQEATHGPPREHRLHAEVIIADLQAAGLDASLAPTHLPDQFIVIGTQR
jgi:SAM-dependent methyltransferase